MVAIGVAQTANAATHQVGPTRTHKTIASVLPQVKPGDVIELDGDATYAGGVKLTPDGTPSAKITLRGIRKNGKRPVLEGGTNTLEAAGDHWLIEGLEITGASFRCFYHHAHDITLRDSVVHDCQWHGVQGATTDSGSLTLDYVEIYNAGESTTRHPIYMDTDQSAHPGSVFRMQHCYIHDGLGGNNVKSRAERNELYYNWIEGAMYHEIELIGGNANPPREDSDVVGNVIVKKGSHYVARFGGDGTGETYGRYRFVNNTVIVQPGGAAVFRLFDGIESLSLHNNVFAVAGGGSLSLVNMSNADWATGSPVIVGSKNWIASGASNLPGGLTGSLFGSDPGFASLAAFDLRPKATSPLIDAGSSTTPDASGHAFPNPLDKPVFMPPLHSLQAPGSALPRPVAGGIDIGAYEHASSGSGGSGGTGSGGAAGSASGGAAGSANGGAAGSANGGAAGSASGGEAGMAQAGAGGSGGEAGSANGGDAGSASGGSAGGDPGDPGDPDAGCTLAIPSRRDSGGVWWVAALGMIALGRRRFDR